MVIPTLDFDNTFLTGCDVEDLGDLDVLHRAVFMIYATLETFMCSIKKKLKSGQFKAKATVIYTRIHQSLIIKLPLPEENRKKEKAMLFWK